MTSAEIQAFLATHHTGSISQAAEQLYISQSSLSSRLHTLERELGCTLFVRSRGSRTLSLSPDGERFLPLAQQHQALEENMLSIAHQEQSDHTLRLSSLSSISSYLLPPVFELFSRRWPDIRLELRSYTTTQARQAIAQGKLDLAFSTLNFSTEHITTLPIAREPAVFLCSEQSYYSDPVSLSDLSVDYEVYTFWYTDLLEWHRTTFGPDFQPQVRLDLLSHIRLFTSRPNAWALVPESAARTLRNAPGLRQCTMDFPIPERPLNILLRRESQKKPSVQYFLDCLRETLTKQQFPGLFL